MGQENHPVTPSSNNHILQFQYASGLGIIGVIFGALITYSFVETRDAVPLFGQVSLTSILASLGFLVGVPIALIAYRILHNQLDTLTDIQRQANRGRYNWFARISTALLVGVFIVIGTVLVFFLISRILPEATVGPMSVLLIAAIYCGFISFGIAFQVSALTSASLLWLTGISIFLGLTLAIANIEDPAWFQNSISYMSHAEGSRLIFQFTFILSGMVLLSVMRDLIQELKILEQMGRFNSTRFNIFTFTLTALPVMVIGIGLFPTTVSPFSDFMHNVSSHVPVGVYMALMLGLNYLMPIYSERFLMISRGFGVLSALVVMGWSVFSLYNFVIFEFLLLIVLGVWTLLFFRETQSYIRQQI